MCIRDRYQRRVHGTIDSIKLANKVNSICANQKINQMRVFVQINISDEDTKYGIEEKDCEQLVRHIIDNCKLLKFSGLMTIGKHKDIEAFKKNVLIEEWNQPKIED
eukprot:TRINITY_DN11346_c0_g1_i1.p1 TRINITY_DN11346_c0_g1~~TRINITY_DN11346_c0_g1_i1.p1  ORF type:complete len:106 (+),score=31.32 TRINITY_DN11346_c0_g1_i1:176-493(+)